MKEYSSEIVALKNNIKNESALYYYRATPFSPYCEFNYNGKLKDDFFFENLFSSQGKSSVYIKEIKKSLETDRHKSILLIGNQGCGKTTFAHFLERECPNYNFLFFDFDEDTSNSTLDEYIEKFSDHLLLLFKSDDDNKINERFFEIYKKNENLINKTINGGNNVREFFDSFYKVFISGGNNRRRKENKSQKNNFIKNINKLFFNQILSLITLWYLSKRIERQKEEDKRKYIFYCDNLDILLNDLIIKKFFEEYFKFVRNIDSILQKLELENSSVSYNSLCVFIFNCRQHTWARVKEHYPHNHNFFQVSTLERNITDAFDKLSILTTRRKYIEDNKEYYEEFLDNVEKVHLVLSDMDSTEKYSHNIYDLFDDDYRQCLITLEEISEHNPDLFEDYFKLKGEAKKYGTSLYGVRGIVYKSLFDYFKNESIFENIGVLDISTSTSLVSKARMLLNYLNFYTYSSTSNLPRNYISFERIVDDFKGIIEKDEISLALIAMFELGYSSNWNELIAFKEIPKEDLKDCSGLKIFITKAGHEYLSLIATHFEFFNTRVIKNKSIDIPLFSPKSHELQKIGNDYKYNFQETISLVLEIVEKCFDNMSKFYDKMIEINQNYEDKNFYLRSPYVYSEVNVLHGERIIHTHIRYIDTYRLFILKKLNNEEQKREINELLVKFIEKYINLGEKYPKILTWMSTEKLFPAFLEKIKLIYEANFFDFTTPIDTK